MTTQVTRNNWLHDSEWLEEQVKATQFMLGTTLDKELLNQMRHAVLEIDTANAMVISYAVTVRNCATYTIEDVQANRHVLQTVTSASTELAKQVARRETAIRTLQLLMTIAMPVPTGADVHTSRDICDRRNEILETVCNRAARRTVQA